MPTANYQHRKGWLATYFDRTAADAWAKLTSDSPVSRIRETVRAGREEMRGTLMSWLPADMTGMRLLDAGCGTGLLAVEAARRGAEVVAIDLSPTLIGVAKERMPDDLAPGSIDFRSGDMLDPALGTFDYAVAMDSIIHYDTPDKVKVVAALAAMTRRAVLFTFAPRTPMLMLMHHAGKFFPRGDRGPSIVPVEESALLAKIATTSELAGWSPGRTRRILTGFYKSQALELRRS
ncbi:magnesium protoporphyrin IX methyltransferase [Magnetospirillum fulvum]|uniref:Magnesium protoporphyrin IX methyltransferase n=1 Tax=Magnetospirillum fulvum TaxID=1082 RepID=A0A1H6HJP6_MAGFU|nr:magnesium protoporphyrin IX methyltransferase [Magnetospirillum fulvum]SEH34320.1 Mg-protoporphyrin IX methyltransferase [Magnetospirillum fulvum]